MILEIEASISTLEVFIEDRYIDYILKYLKTLQVRSFKIESNENISEDYIPINTLTHSHIFSNYMNCRKLKITSFQFILNLHWSTVCFISFKRSRFGLDEFQKNNMIISLHQLGQCVLIHYFDSLINNISSVMNSLELLGAPGNFIHIMKRGFCDLTSMLVHGYAQGSIGLLIGLAKGSRSLIKHLSLGILLSILSFISSWSRTFENLNYFKCITKHIAKVLKALETAINYCTIFIDCNQDRYITQ